MPHPDPEPDDVVRTAPLPRGRRLVVRRCRTADAAGLALLYGSLSADDRYRRFFSSWQPPKEKVQRWAAGADGGQRLVAVVTAEGEPDRIVAEASYSLLTDGDGELAMVVAEDWRGWLGPYLLDTLLDAAAARGVRNIQAEVLAENRRMLTTLLPRGYAVRHHDGAVVRVVVGTGPDRVPTWPPREHRPRVLVEVGGARWGREPDASSAHLAVLACPGPRPWCPVLAGRACPLAAGADAVVVCLPPGELSTRAVVRAHHRRHPGALLCGEHRPVCPGAVDLPAFGHGELAMRLLRSRLRRRRAGGPPATRRWGTSGAASGRRGGRGGWSAPARGT